MSFILQTGLPDFPITLPMHHNLGHPGDFWSPATFGIHPTLLPTANHMLHPNLIPNYKIPNIHAAIMQYMGLNSLFNGERANNYTIAPQNLSVNTSATRSSSPQNSPIESPSREAEK